MGFFLGVVGGWNEYDRLVLVLIPLLSFAYLLLIPWSKSGLTIIILFPKPVGLRSYAKKADLEIRGPTKKKLITTEDVFLLPFFCEEAFFQE